MLSPYGESAPRVIPYDPAVRQFLKRPGIFQLQAPTSATAAAVDRLAHRVINFWDIPIEGSSELLAEYARGVLPASKTDLEGEAGERAGT